MSTKLWRISGFEEGPHWEVAFVWAPDADEAKRHLAVALESDDRPGTVWEPNKDYDDWCVSEVNPAGSAVAFVLGAGCRG